MSLQSTELVQGRVGKPENLTNAGKGRTKGVPNKLTVEFKQAVNNLLAYAAPEMVGWLKEVADKDPEKALAIVDKFAEYCAPKLSRTELTGVDGGPVVIQVDPTDTQL